MTLNAQQYVDTGYKFSYFGLQIDVISVNGGPPGGITEGGTRLTLQVYIYAAGYQPTPTPTPTPPPTPNASPNLNPQPRP